MMHGSKWLRCDLHVHSPSSFIHGYGDRRNPATWERFLSEIEGLPHDFKIIGINDYLTIDGYLRLRKEKAGGRLSNIDCILPVIEFRLNRLVGEGATKRLNYHVIFSDAVDPATIQSQFLNAIGASYQLEAGNKDPTWSGIISEESLKELGKLVKAQSPGNASLQAKPDWEVGFNNFNVDHTQLQEILEFTPFKGRVITAIGKSEWDQYRWDGGGAAEKRSIINQTDVVFLSVDSVAQHEKSRQALVSQNVNALLLDCSDAHYFSDSNQKDRIGNCFTWIKAEASFDGLKQILYESDYRISISETNPDKKPPYQVIDRVRFVGNGEVFGNQELEFSPYLNSIIGGKSTGKSILAGLIVKSADILEYQRRCLPKLGGGATDPLAWLDQDAAAMDFEVIWRDGATTSLRSESTRKVTYFPQHYLNSSIDKQGTGNKEVNKLIRNVLAQNAIYSGAFEEYRAGLQGLDEEIAAAATAFQNALRDWREQKHHLGEKGKSADIQANIDRLQAEFSEMQRRYNLSEQEITTHAQLSSDLASLNEQKSVLSLEISVLGDIDADALSKRTTLDTLMPGIDLVVSARLYSDIREVVAPAIASFHASIVEAMAPLKTARTGALPGIDRAIADANQRLQPILDKIAGAAPLQEKSSLINGERLKLGEVLELERSIRTTEDRIQTLAAELKGFVDKRLTLAVSIINVVQEHPVSKGDGDLGIEIEPRVKSVHVRDLLRDRLKYQSNQPVRDFVQNPEPKDDDFDAYMFAVHTIVQQAIEGVIEFKGEYNLTGVLQELLGNSVYLNYNLTLSNDSFSIMSPGKRALALLRIIIELDASEHPIILDQPEDDLDNRSIYDGLATYLKRKKQLRQIIVVTHNPNVVVGGDSEYVIVANQTGQESNRDNENYRFEYVFGGMECSFLNDQVKWVLYRQGIKEHICEILDGGKDAFLRREKLYSTLKAFVDARSAA
jgi:hypothetical protein